MVEKRELTNEEKCELIKKKINEFISENYKTRDIRIRQFWMDIRIKKVFMMDIKYFMTVKNKCSKNI